MKIPEWAMATPEIEVLSKAETAAKIRGLAFDLNAEHRYNWRWFTDAVDAHPELERWQDEDPMWPLFGREVMARLTSGDGLDESDDPQAWAERAHGIAAALPEWGELVDLCYGERWDAGIAAMAVSKATLRAYQEQQQEPQQDEPDQDGEECPACGGARSPGGLCGQPCDPPPQEPQDGPVSDDPGDGANAPAPDGTPQGAPTPAQDDGNQPQPQPGRRHDPTEGRIRQAMRVAMRQAAEQVVEEREAADALGLGWGNDGGALGRVDPADRAKLAKLLQGNPALRKMVRLLGRVLRSASRKRRTSVIHEPAEIADITLGFDLPRTLPAELVKLADPDLAADLERRMLERKVMTYELTGRESAERGPVVICVDFSGSMVGPRSTLAVATALAIAQTAVKDGRAALVVPYDTRALDPVEFTKPTLLEACIEVASLAPFPGAGTNWMQPMDRAQEFIERQDAAGGKWEGADIVNVTDGECGVVAAWLTAFDAFRSKVGVTVYGMLVGDMSGAAALAKLCDEVYQVPDPTADAGESAADILVRIKEEGR